MKLLNVQALCTPVKSGTPENYLLESITHHGSDSCRIHYEELSWNSDYRLIRGTFRSPWYNSHPSGLRLHFCAGPVLFRFLLNILYIR